MATPTLGTKMQTAAPTVVGGKPTSSFWSRLAKWTDEISAKVSNPAITATAITAPAITVTAITATVITATDIKHGDRTVDLGYGAIVPAGTVTTPVAWLDGNGFWTLNAAGGGSAVGEISLSVGDRLKSVSVYILGATAVLTADLKKVTASSGTVTSLGTAASASGATNQTLTIGSLTETVAAGVLYSVRLSATASSHRVYGLSYTFDRP